MRSNLLPTPRAAAAHVPSRSTSTPRWYAHAYNRSGYYRLALAAAPRLPRAVRRWMATGAARLVEHRFGAERGAVRRNLARVHPGRNGAWLDSAVRAVFENFGVCFADLVSLNRGPAPGLWRHVTAVSGAAHPEAVLAGGRGCVFITGHLGNWELAGRLLATFRRRVHVVMAPEPDAAVAAILHDGTDRDVRFVRCESPLLTVELVAALRRGDIVAFQLDRATGERGDCRVPFFRAEAAFPLGPFLMASAAGAPVVAAFCILESGGDYRLCVEPAFDVARGEEALGLARAVAILERYVSAYSTQWFNFYDMWDRNGDG